MEILSKDTRAISTMRRMWTLVAILPLILMLNFSYFYIMIQENVLLHKQIKVLNKRIFHLDFINTKITVLNDQLSSTVAQELKIVEEANEEFNQGLEYLKPHSVDLWKKSENDWSGMNSCFITILSQNGSSAECEKDLKTRIPLDIHRNKLLESNLALQIEEIDRRIYMLLFATAVFTISGIVFIYFHYKKHYCSPLQKILQVTTAASTGIISEKINYTAADEIGKISMALDKILENQLSVSVFAENIGDGKFDTNYSILGPQDKLGISLTGMRDKLLKVAEEDRRRRWTNEGLARFAEILRNENENVEKLCDTLLSNLVKYLNANQGRIFLTSEIEEQVVLILKAAYAWDRKKFLEQEIKIGEGLVGQAAIEMETIFLTDVPKNYIHITSGTGSASPTCVIIIPLKLNGHLQGVLEVASFNVLESFEKDFLEKLGEVIASTLSNVEINENTKNLLEESRKMTENLQVQEEELRQNTEELKATQENLHKLLAEARKEMHQQIEDLEIEKKKNIAILEGCVDGVITFDHTGTVEFFNKSAEQIWNINKEDALKLTVKDLMNVEIIRYDDKYEVWHMSSNNKKILDIRSEITLKTSEDNDCPVLVTLSKAQVGSQHIFTAFIQSIAVELF